MLVWIVLLLMTCALVNVFATVSCGFNGFPVPPHTACEATVLFLNIVFCFALVFMLLRMGTSGGALGDW